MSSSAVLLPILLLLVGLAIGAVIGYLGALARRTTAHQSDGEQVAELRAQAAQWQARAEELSSRTQVAEERAERDGSVLRALAPVRSQLEQVGARVESLEKQRAEQHAALAEQLRATALREQDLARSTASLEGALRSRSARGMWGEVELARVLEASGMMRHVDFSEQRTIGALVQRRGGPAGPPGSVGSVGSAAGEGAAGRSRPDVVVHLPGEGYLAVDAKAPMDSYLAATAVQGSGPEDEERRGQLLEAHARALRGHVDQLAARRYDRALGDSPELVVLFVPAEAVLSAALEADPALLEHALGRGVALASPVSLLTLLRTCATAWARTAVNDDARELLELGRTLYERLGTVAGHLDALGGALRRSVTAYNKAVGSMENRLLVTARSLETLGEQVDSPTLISADAAQVRTFTAPELTTDGHPASTTA
ncbi:DNA recombination protein RmuC [Actinomyces viscosus]|uniref:DNA recombination protein RmuC n=1 Tax=Actinomyces viscosus TaxID=1656 RepID=A0ABT7TZS9_ACTVI|nr:MULTISPECIES: DNA recombination protein RmuC [Actinomyces]MDM8077327.1 DNA recombination protein RmuC [Actinomyces viscosus]MDR0179815.1 DNA recombination protein RmuC [Actinomyces oris]